MPIRARGLLTMSLDEEAVPHHFAAVSTNLEACAQFGIASDRIFGFWDWGRRPRYSVCGSAIGLPIMLAVGYENFAAFLKGAAEMECPFPRGRRWNRTCR